MNEWDDVTQIVCYIFFFIPINLLVDPPTTSQETPLNSASSFTATSSLKFPKRLYIEVEIKNYLNDHDAQKTK